MSERTVNTLILICAIAFGMYASISLYGDLRTASFEVVQALAVCMMYYLGVYTATKEVCQAFFT